MTSILAVNLSKISYLEQTLFIDCAQGNVSIDKLNTGQFYVEHPYFPNNIRRMFNPNEVDQLIGFLGPIKSIMMLDHDLDEEIWLY
jgi:hypothetical protein